MKVTLAAGCLFMLFAPLAGVHAQESSDLNVLMQAMRDELARTTEQLRMEELERPYFVAYTIRDTEQLQVEASFGALLPGSKARNRNLNVEIRVGDPAFDNTNFEALSLFSLRFEARAVLPVEDDYREIRRQLWLATDAAYKAALESLAQKRAALQNETRAEDLADFTTEEPFTFVDGPGPDLPPQPDVESLVRTLSGSFTKMPDVFESKVSSVIRNQRTFYANSEGSSFIRSDPAASVVVQAQTQATDGTVLNDFVSAFGRSWDEINDQEVLEARVQTLGSNLAARRSVPTIDRYSGPVLFEGQAAAELFVQVFMPRLVGARIPDAEPRFAMILQQNRNPFQDRIGARVLPRSLNVHDDPTLGDGFLGGYEVDDDGVQARAKPLIENGILKTLLTTRNPIPGIDKSTGNRRGEGPLPSNLVLTSNRAMTREELDDEFAQLIAERGAEYGVVVRRLGNPSLQFSSSFSMEAMLARSRGQSPVHTASLAYKVYPDGREELIPRAELVAVTDAAFKDIVGVSDTSTLYSFTHNASGGLLPSSILGASMGSPVVTVSTPDLLFEEVTIRKPSGNVPHLPVAAHPSFDR